jgi:glycosyltransferase involved in cell wall biosynthesis
MTRDVLHVNDCSSVAALLVRGLRQQGWDARLVQPRIRPPYGGGRRRSGLRDNRIYFAADRARLAWRLRCAREAGLLHVHYGMFGALGVMADQPFVLHFHGQDLRLDNQRWLFRSIHRAAARKARACLVSSPNLLEFESDLGRELHFLPNPVPVESATDHLPEGNYVLFSSKVDESKGAELFIPAAEELASRGIPVVLLAFGSRADVWSSRLHNLERMGARILWERMNHEHFRKLIARARVIVGQFNVGALGMTELEAMALRKAVVTRFDYPGVYDDEPPIANSGTPEEIGHRVVELWNHEEARAVLGTRAFDWICRTHELGVSTRRLIELYRRNAFDVLSTRARERAVNSPADTDLLDGADKRVKDSIAPVSKLGDRHRIAGSEADAGQLIR